MITVRIGGNEFPQGFAECGCGTQRPRPKLVIRRHRDIFLLARWPEQAHQHAAACPFNRQTLAKSGPADNLDAFRLKDGHHDIRLGVALSVSTRTPAATVQRSAQGQSSKPQRRSAGLLAFLEYAWEQAGLNVWPGTGYRGWTACWSQLTTELAGCRINGTSADGLLHIVQRWDPSRKAEILAEFDAWQARLTPTAAGNPRGIVIGQLESHEPSQYGGKLVLRQSRQRYFLNADLYARLQSSFGSALSAVGRDDQRCVAILLVEMSKGGYLRVVDVAAMLTNSHFVPCDSSHEIAMADRLIAERRAFRKPLRHIGRAATHPDFILTDAAPEVVIEVLGMSGNADYDARIAEKRSQYRASGIPFLEWNVKSGPVASVHLPPANRSNDGA